MLSDRSKANFPADPQQKRAKQQKALTAGQSLLALTDQDEAWGKWKPSGSRSSKDAVISNPVTVKREEAEPSTATSAGAYPSQKLAKASWTFSGSKKTFHQATSFNVCYHMPLPFLMSSRHFFNHCLCQFSSPDVDGNQRQSQCTT